MKDVKLNELHYMAINYLSLIMLVPAVLYLKDIEWTWLFVTVLVFLTVLFGISFYYAYHRTGKWKFVHSSLDILDERELKIVGGTSRRAYAVFTVVALLIMLVLSVTELSINIMFTAALIYFAHILPASILVFKERNDKVSDEDEE